jgi:hypothetical protein
MQGQRDDEDVVEIRVPLKICRDDVVRRTRRIETAAEVRRIPRNLVKYPQRSVRLVVPESPRGMVTIERSPVQRRDEDVRILPAAHRTCNQRATA